MPSTSETIAQNIRYLAKKRGMTLNRLADFAGVSQAQLYDVLAGRKSPTVSWLEKVAQALGVPVSALVIDARTGQI